MSTKENQYANLDFTVTDLPDADTLTASAAGTEAAPKASKKPKAAKPGKAPGKKPKATETRNRHLNILVTPSMYSDLDKIKVITRQESMNDMVCKILDNYIAKHAKDIEKYDTVFSEK